MKRLLVVAVAGLALLSACSDSTNAPLAPPSPDADAARLSPTAAGVVRVQNENHSGPGSFRQAILDANGDPSITNVEFDPSVGTVALQDPPVIFTGTQSLKIDGNHATINGAGLSAGASAFRVDGGGNLEIANLTLRSAPGTGLTVAIPGAATGTIKVSLI
ncbi:MAG: hypothetical protein ACREOG_11795, partial [Gemmatimonadaceae bacterium]